jgi:drug/metabolite transporter (DMT)-like permease
MEGGHRVIVAAYIISALLLGSNWYATRVSLAGYPPITAAAVRFAIAAVVFLGIIAAGYGGPRPNRREAAWLTFAGVLNAVQYGLFYFALVWISGGLAAVIFGTVQLTTALFTAVTKIEKVTWSSVAGAPISVAGLAFVYWDRLGLSGVQAWGVLLMLASVVVSSAGTVVLKHFGRRVSPVLTTSAFTAFTALVLGIAAALLEHDKWAWPSSPWPTVAILYQGLLGTAAGFGVYFYMLKRVSAITAASIALVLPVVALVIDVIAQEPLRLTGTAYVGVGLTLGGVLFGFLFKLRKAPAPVAAVAPAK